MAKALGARARRPWRCSQGPEGDAKAAMGVQPRSGVTAKGAVAMQPRPWGHGLGTGGAAKAAVESRLRPWGCGQGGHGDAAQALGVWLRRQWGCG